MGAALLDVDVDVDVGVDVDVDVGLHGPEVTQVITVLVA